MYFTSRNSSFVFEFEVFSSFKDNLIRFDTALITKDSLNEYDPMKKYWLVVLLLIGTSVIEAQDKSKPIQLLEVELHTEIGFYGDDFVLLTGEESIYLEHDWLRKSLLKNIADGIREGEYIGSDYNTINEVKASKTTFYFYNDKLYKVRWFFYPYEYSDITALAEELNRYLERKFGNGKDEKFIPLKVWNGNRNYLQSFMDDQEFQIEYRDAITHDIVRKLND